MTGMNKRIRIGHLSTQKSLVGIIIIITLSWLVVMCHCDFFQDAYAQVQNQSVQTSIPDDKSPTVAYLTDGPLAMPPGEHLLTTLDKK